MNEGNENSTLKDKIIGLYGLGILGFTSDSYSVDGFWIALGKSLIWPISLGIYLVEKFS
jgi:hypothetical protein